VLRAAREPVELDEKQANAVAARIELDLRIGAAFTRLQTLQLQTLGSPLDQRTISYGVFRPWMFYKQRLTGRQDHASFRHWVL
jgi:DNA topoisomerase IA